MKRFMMLSLVLVPVVLGFNMVMAQRPSKVVIAAVSFINQTGDQTLDNFKTQIPDQIFAILGRGGDLMLVDRAAFERAIEELKRGQTEYIDPEKAAQIGKQFGATAIIFGSISKWTENTYSINARLVTTETGLVMASESVRGSKNEMLDLCDKIAASFRTALGIKPEKKGSIISKPWFLGVLAAGIGGGAYVVYDIISGGEKESKEANVSVSITLP